MDDETVGLTQAQLLAEVPYLPMEIFWGILLFFGICVVNVLVLFVVVNSRELWDKPRHLWMACLCVTDLFVAAHKGLELFLILCPVKELCILKRTTLGIPYVVNVCLLSMLSVDRFVAVRYPFYYSNTVSNKHVMIGFSTVLAMGILLAILSMGHSLRRRHVICRPQPFQLVAITILLTFCSLLIFICNIYVLRIAKKQIDVIRAQEIRTTGSHQVSNTSSVNRQLISKFYCQMTFCCRLIPPPTTLTMTRQPSIMSMSLPSRQEIPEEVRPISMKFPEINNISTVEEAGRNQNGRIELDTTSMTSSSAPEQLSLDLGTPIYPGCSTLGPISLPISISGNFPQPVVLPPADLNVKIEIQSCHPHETMSTLEATLESHHVTETLTPLSRAISLPALPRSGNVILVIPSDPTVKTTAKILSGGSSIEMTKDYNDQDVSINSKKTNPSSMSKIHLSKFPEVTHTIKVSLPRSRSFTGGKKFSTVHDRPVRHNFLKTFHLTGSPGLSHAWRLMPSRRFANTVLIIMIPMWLFLTPIVVIIPMQRRCMDQDEGVQVELNCDIVNTMWIYLQIHMRSILPLQAILDTLIYACASKEFRRAFKRYIPR